MKKTTDILRKKITFSNFFSGAILIGLIFLIVSFLIHVGYVYENNQIIKNNNIKIEELLTALVKDNKRNKKDFSTQNIEKSLEFNNETFMAQYYSIQSNWLNIWLATLAIIMAVLGIIIPICFVKFLENKEKEMDRIINDANEQVKQARAEVENINKQSLNNLSIMEAKLTEVNQKSEQMSKDLSEVKNYVDDAKISANLSEAIELFNKEKYDETIELLFNILKIKPEDEKINMLIAKCFFEKNLLLETIKYTTNILSKNDSHGYALIYRSLAYSRRKELKHALKDIDKIISLKPKIKIHYIEKSLILSSSNTPDDKQKAEKILMDIPLDKLSDSELNCIGLCYIRLQDIEKAEKIYTETNLYKRYPIAKLNLCKIYIIKNRYKEAALLLTKYIADCKKPIIYDDDYNYWYDKITTSEQTEYTTVLLNSMKKLIIKKRKGDDFEG